jgi:hypothetical protein
MAVKYPLREMRVGDRFEVRGVRRWRIAGGLYNRAKQLGIRVSVYQREGFVEVVRQANSALKSPSPETAGE